MTSEVRRELEQLLSALCDGLLSPQQQGQLEALLQSDPECRRLYLEYVDMHSRLLLRPQTDEAASLALPADALLASAVSPNALAVQRAVRIPQPLRYIIVAAVTLAASLLVQAYWYNPTPLVARRSFPPSVVLPAAPIATLTHAVDCIWEPPSEEWRVGSRLAPAELRLKEGVARLHFDSGPELMVEGPTVLRLESSEAATVLHGRVFFRGSETAAPFKLKTPNATLVDLGTEYAVVVGPEGEEVYVLDGQVERTASSGPTDSEQLNAGEGRRYAPDAAAAPAEFDPAQFQRLLNGDERPAAVLDEGLLAYEPFDYADPHLLPDGMAHGGTGWTAPWRSGFARPRNEGDENRLALNVKESLVRAGASRPSLGGSFDYTGFTKYFRPMAMPIRMDSDNVYYVSFLMRREGPSEEQLNSSAVLLRTSDELEREHQGQENRRERLNIGVHRVNHLFTHLHGVEARMPLPLSYGETYLLVAKIAASAAGPDQVFIRVYGPQEPVEREDFGSWTMVGPQFDSNLVFDWLEVHINSISRKVLDEIRVGTTWASVAGPWITNVAEAEKNP
jgi:hypothetical protein